jgi:EAL domain-containing protein (putative c-di-GMP-specific phosphodiesterase class I)
LHSKGFKTAVDDFGDNDARLLPLRNLNVDEVKLGQSILVNATVKSVDEIFINTIKTYCDQMGISFVVSNIQNELILAKLREMGVDQFQGDILCPFISENEMNGWLARYFKESLG